VGNCAEIHLVSTPRGLSRVQAAAYVGVSPSKFDEMVEDERMPRPREVDKRLLWDRLELDEAFSALPHRNGPDQIGDVFDECRV
jgi:predicted DNA-binding transcriptional regulator AlpA